MEKQSFGRVLISLVAAVVVSFLVYLTFPAQNYQPRGMLLPAQTIRTAINPDQVTLYTSMPFTASQLGLINMSMHIEGQSQEELQVAILEKARELAATVGANGVVISVAVPVGTGNFHVLAFRGLAVYVPTSKLTNL